MFERWDPDRDIKADVPSDFDKLHLFSSIAANMFGDPELAEGGLVKRRDQALSRSSIRE
jgi:hypothetical protein